MKLLGKFLLSIIFIVTVTSFYIYVCISIAHYYNASFIFFSTASLICLGLLVTIQIVKKEYQSYLIDKFKYKDKGKNAQYVKRNTKAMSYLSLFLLIISVISIWHPNLINDLINLL